MVGLILEEFFCVLLVSLSFDIQSELKLYTFQIHSAVSCITSGTEAMFADLGYYGQAPVRVCTGNNYEFDFQLHN